MQFISTMLSQHDRLPGQGLVDHNVLWPCFFPQVGLFGVNLIGQPTSTTNSDGDWWEKIKVNENIAEHLFWIDNHVCLFNMTRLEDGDVLSPYDDLSFLMYTDSEVRWTDNQPTNQPTTISMTFCLRLPSWLRNWRRKSWRQWPLNASNMLKRSSPPLVRNYPNIMIFLLYHILTACVTLTLQSEKVEINKHCVKTTIVRLCLFPPSSPSPSPPGELVEAGQMLASLQMEKRFLCQLLSNCTNQKILIFGNDK